MRLKTTRINLFICFFSLVWFIVPPTFEVKLQPSKSFFYVGDESLTVDIEAK